MEKCLNTNKKTPTIRPDRMRNDFVQLALSYRGSPIGTLPLSPFFRADAAHLIFEGLIFILKIFLLYILLTSEGALQI